MVQEALAAAGIQIPIYFGIVPLLSARNAEFLHNEVPGMRVPEEVRRRISAWESAADQRACGIEIATELVCAFRERVPGFYFICPRNRAELMLPLINAARSA